MLTISSFNNFVNFNTIFNANLLTREEVDQLTAYVEQEIDVLVAATLSQDKKIV